MTSLGVAELLERLAASGPVALIVVEATGGYEIPLVAALSTAGLPVVVINPRQVRDFARALGKLAKTDAIDAAVLAHFAEAVQPEPRALADELTQALQGWLARRRQLLEMVLAEEQRLALATPVIAPRSSSISSGYAVSCGTSTRICKTRSARVRCGERVRICCAPLRGRPGAGHHAARRSTRARTTQSTPDAALVGVAPLNWDSGQQRGTRHIWGGRRPCGPPCTWPRSRRCVAIP